MEKSGNHGDHGVWAPIGHHSPATEKIALFRSLFRGRDDVYPRRYENQRTGSAVAMHRSGLSLLLQSSVDGTRAAAL